MNPLSWTFDYDKNLSSYKADQALKNSEKSIAAVKNKALSSETSDFNPKSTLNIAEMPKGGLKDLPADIFNPNSPINKDLPTFGESLKGSEAMGGAGWAAGAKALGKALVMLDPEGGKEWTEPIAANTRKNVDLGWRLQDQIYYS